VVNGDAQLAGRLRVVFLPNYGVSLAQKIIPAADLSEQISTAGYEASGTGNMKLSLNGALTIGTLDGANIEIRDAVGAENFFLFGLTAEEVVAEKARGYRGGEAYERDALARAALDLIASGFFSPEQPRLFQPLIDGLLQDDRYLVLADFAGYAECHDRVAAAWRDPDRWAKMAILNVARAGRFSSDRSIRDYATRIWNARAVPVTL
jgi:starch phosphorylase